MRAGRFGHLRAVDLGPRREGGEDNGLSSSPCCRCVFFTLPTCFLPFCGGSRGLTPICFFFSCLSKFWVNVSREAQRQMTTGSDTCSNHRCAVVQLPAVAARALDLCSGLTAEAGRGGCTHGHRGGIEIFLQHETEATRHVSGNRTSKVRPKME